jgi:hypothetical protein
MNLRRGFFRLWLVLAALFVIATAVVSFPDVKSEFKKAAADADFVPDVPVACTDARGKIGGDYLRDPSPPPQAPPSPPTADKDPFADLRASSPGYEARDNNCWYSINKFRPLYPEYKDLTDDQVSDRLYEKAGFPRIPPASPWTLLSKVIGIAIGVPLIILAIGSALGWSFGGFFSEQKHTHV